ncbi:MAG: GIY-YIG nuclease family protein [Saprospiraceae bacterium]|nr:GIY-YIG nuclease family protein [Saprospiraceae bacterium]
MFFTYILQSQSDGSFYVGYTSNLEQRLNQHNQGLSRYTKGKTPWVIAYCESFETKSEAIKREIFLKNQRNKDFFLSLITGSSVG